MYEDIGNIVSAVAVDLSDIVFRYITAEFDIRADIYIDGHKTSIVIKNTERKTSCKIEGMEEEDRE